MSKLHFSDDLFLETKEVLRNQSFIERDGFRQTLLLNTKSFGIVKGVNVQDLIIPDSEVFEVTSVGASTNNVNVNIGRAVNNDGEVITLLSQLTLNIPNTGFFYWLKIAYKERYTELGTVSIDVNGNMTGVSTFFREVLRGQPNFPSKIKFVGSAGNLLEYEVTQVVSDTVAIISGPAGSFANESNLQYEVVGTFTPGFVPLTQDKFIFRYDDCLVTIVQENPGTPNVAPSKTAGEEFWIARVKTNGLNCIVHDKRTEFWLTKAGYEFKFLERARAIPNIGCESVRWDINTTTRDKNEVTIAWGFDSSNWTIDPTSKLITINGGSGGLFKTSGDFTTGDFDGHRLYAVDGSFEIIKSSQKVGSQINLFLDYLNPDNYTGGDLLRIVPNTEEIGIIVAGDYTSGVLYKHQLEEVFVFKTIERRGKLMLRVVDKDNPYFYNIRYSQGSYKEGCPIYIMPSDNTFGHWTELAYDEQGNFLPIVGASSDADNRTAGRLRFYTASLAGYIQIIPHPDNYAAEIARIDLGDKLGIREYNLNSMTPPVLRLIVSVDLQYQRFTGPLYTTVSPTHINLETFQDYPTNTIPCRNGNFFYLHFKQPIDTALGQIRVTQGYSGSTVVLWETDKDDVSFINYSEEGIFLRCSYDGTNWVVATVNEINRDAIGTVKMYFGPSLADFDGAGLGITKPWKGWALLDGQGGRPNMSGRVPMGLLGGDPNFGYLGQTGGDDQVVLTDTQLPPHHHNFDYEIKPNYIYGGAGPWENAVANINNGGVPVYPAGNGQTNDGPGNSDPITIPRPRFVTFAYVMRIA